jgi:hypothetical protein
MDTRPDAGKDRHDRYALQVLAAWLTIVLLLASAGCGSTPEPAPLSHSSRITEAGRRFYVSALANEAWFVVHAQPGEVESLRVSPGQSLRGPLWAEFNRILAACTPDWGERVALQTEAIHLVLAKL